MKKTVAVDMDGVLADVENHFLNLYNQNFGTKLTYEDIKGKPEREAFPDPGVVMKFASTPGFFRTVPVMKDAVEGLKKLCDIFDVYVVSSAMEFPQFLEEKYDWLAEHFPFIHWKKIVLCGDKKIVNTDFMIDDHCKNLDFFKGTPILFSAFHNIDVDKYVRVDNWKDVVSLLKIYA
ncbi:5' nucleotidase, NT5C type [Pustulibacterium marinum]|nr:5'(3')-deoxyribonucleotidase [Pustulibacterium marinum]